MENETLQTSKMKSYDKVKIHCQHTGMVSVDELKPNPKNPNVHTKDQIERLALVIQENGFRRPIVVSNQTGFMTVGHGRLEASKHLNMTHVPVDYQDYDSEDLEYADMVADNALGEWSDLDLSKINTDMGDLGPDFDIALLGLKDLSLDFSEKIDLDDIPDKLEDKKYILEIEFSTEKEMKCEYDRLTSIGLIVRTKVK